MAENIFDVADRFRKSLLQRERAAATEMVRRYGDIWKRIKARLQELLTQMQEAQKAGEEVKPSWLFEMGRLESLKRQVEREIAELAQYADEAIRQQQEEAIRRAQQEMEQLALAGLGEPPPGVIVRWEYLPRQALQDLVGFLQDGSPLRTVLGELGPQAGAALERALVSGVAMGLNPREIVRRARKELGKSLVRSLRIARTEVMRAYREAGLRSMRANSDLVRGWIWHSAANERTCPACWAMHGTVHTLDERLGDHPNGRCAMVPITKTWSELGYEGVPEERLEVDSGENIFASLPEAQQLAIIGRRALEAYKSGAIRLKDFVGWRHDPRWGTTIFVKSLRLGRRK